MEESEAVTPPDLPLRVRTLGGIGVSGKGGDTLVLPPGKPLALLVYLSTLPDHRASREHLVDLLWADLEPGDARHALRQMTLYLRHRVGRPALTVIHDDLQLAVPVESDHASFLTAVEAGRLEEAVEIYRGEFLPRFAVPGGTAFEHWAEAERRRLHLLFRRAAESLARLESKQGHFRKARDLARRVRDADQLDESGWRLLIEACLAQGDRVSALAESQRLEELLSSEERTPEPGTQAVLRRAGAEPDAVHQSLDTALVAELVGREKEFATLLQVFERTRRGFTDIISVVAPAGLGKTRLLRDVGRRLAAEGSPAVYVRAQPADRDVPWSYAADLARQLGARPGARGVSPASAASLIALEPSLSGRLAGAPDSSTGVEAQRRRVAALTELVQSVAEERPLALLLDDLHWADAPSREALQRAMPRVHGAGVLVVLAARPGGHLGGPEASQVVQLSALNPQQIDALVASLASIPEAPWTQALGERLHAATGGSPLLVIETLQLALENGCLKRENGNWTCLDDAALRALLEAGSAVGRRLSQLDGTQTRLLLLLALGGITLGTGILAAAAGLDRERTITSLNDLERRGLVTRHGEDWAVAHDEIADRVTEQAETDQAHAAHAALGRTLVAASPDTAALRLAARHLEAASLEPELANAVVRWVRRARDQGDRRSAHILVTELLGQTGDDGRVGRVLASLPWRVRVGPVARLSAVAAAAAAVVVLLALAFLPPRPESPQVLLATLSQEATGQWRIHARALNQRDIAAGSVAISSLQRTDLVAPDGARGIPRPGSLSMMASVRAYPDSGGEDITLVTADAPPVRLTHRPGDDYPGSWSPDGRYLAIVTDRWTDRNRSNIAILDLDRPDWMLTRLTSNPLTRDAAPLWSPDGTRIAFRRGAYGDRPPEFCLVSVDGRDERCLKNLPGSQRGDLLGWVSAIELAGIYTDSGDTSRIFAINTETGEFRQVAEGEGLGTSHLPGWIACFCRRNAGEPRQALLLPAANPDRAIRITPGDPPPEIALFPWAKPRAYLQRLAIERPEDAVPVDAVYRLVLRGWDAVGAPIEATAVRWSASDTSIAVVDRRGVLRPRRQGSVTLTATAGGWRHDTVAVRVGPAETRPLLTENWQQGIEPRWVPFGDPRPFIAASDRGPALAPNGDSTFVSGAFLTQRLPIHKGLGVTFRASIPVTRSEWQQLTVLLLSTESLNVSGWDLERGHVPMPNEAWRTCYLAYPSPESPRPQERLLFSGGVSRLLPAPAAVAGGRWVRFRIQLFADRRCGLAVDGRPIAILDRRTLPGDSAMLMIRSSSHGTRILVGAVEVWQGVRRDVDWSILDQK